MYSCVVPREYGSKCETDTLSVKDVSGCTYSAIRLVLAGIEL